MPASTRDTHTSILILGLLFVLGIHSLRIVADGWRMQMIARLGENGWKGLFAVVSIIAFVLIVWDSRASSW